MAKIERGSFTPSSTGNTTVFFADNTMVADEMEFSLAATTGSVGDLQSCDGFMTPTQQCAKSLFADSTAGERTEQTNSKCILHYAKVGGTPTKVAEATRVDMATAGEFTINIGTWGANYQIFFIAREY